MTPTTPTPTMTTATSATATATATPSADDKTDVVSLRSLLGHLATSQAFRSHLAALAGAGSPLAFIIKSYPDAVYYNLPSHAVSYVFEPLPGYAAPKQPLGGSVQRDDVDENRLKLVSVDVYNHDLLREEREEGPRPRNDDAHAHRPWPSFPLRVGASPRFLSIHPSTTATDLVAALGEPTRKGGGEEAPGSLGTGIWLEWTDLGLMAEMGGQRSRGFDRWEKERGGAARWKVLTFFKPEGEEANTSPDDGG